MTVGIPYAVVESSVDDTAWLHSRWEAKPKALVACAQSAAGSAFVPLCFPASHCLSHLHPPLHPRCHHPSSPQSLQGLCVREARHTMSSALAGPTGSEHSATHVLISSDCLIDVARGELIQLLVVPKDNNSHVDGTQYGQLVRFLEETALAFKECSVSDAALALSIVFGAVLCILWTPRTPHIGHQHPVTYTERFRSSLIALISILRRPMVE